MLVGRRWQRILSLRGLGHTQKQREPVEKSMGGVNESGRFSRLTCGCRARFPSGPYDNLRVFCRTGISGSGIVGRYWLSVIGTFAGFFRFRESFAIPESNAT